MEDKKERYTLWGIIILLLIALVFSAIHSFETTAYVRCDGNSVFPIAQNDTVYEGNLKLDNALFSHLGRRIELHEPMTGGSVYAGFKKGCIYQIMGDWEWR